jgi:polyhydroxyalkanoate synthesis repressor PhaR
MSNVRVIKRYANRKLYDTSESKYIKLGEVADMVDAGVELRIIDNTTKEDITRITMAQIIVERSRKGALGDSMTSLKGLIRNTGEQISRKISEPVTSLRSSVEESVTKIIKTGEERASETKEQVNSWIAENTIAIEEMQNRFDERVRSTTARFESIAQMRGHIESLEKRVEILEKKLAEAGQKASSPDSKAP